MPSSAHDTRGQSPRTGRTMTFATAIMNLSRPIDVITSARAFHGVRVANNSCRSSSSSSSSEQHIYGIEVFDGTIDFYFCTTAPFSASELVYGCAAAVMINEAAHRTEWCGTPEYINMDRKKIRKNREKEKKKRKTLKKDVEKYWSSDVGCRVTFVDREFVSVFFCSTNKALNSNWLDYYYFRHWKYGSSRGKNSEK